MKSFLFRAATIGAIAETTYGEEPTPSVTAAELFLAEAIEIAPSGDVVERPLQHGSVANQPHLIGRKWCELRFTTELKGDLQNVDSLLLASGMQKNALVYTPDSQIVGVVASATIYVYAGGNLFILKGAVGTFELVMVAGDRALINWDFRAIWTDPSATTLVEGTAYSSVVPPIFENSAFTLGSASLCIETLNLAMNNTIATRVCSNSSAGVAGFIISARAVGGSINPEAQDETDHPFFTDWAAGTLKTISALVGSVDGNKITIACPVVKAEAIAYGDRDGVRVIDTLDLRCYETTKDDEISITYTVAA